MTLTGIVITASVLKVFVNCIARAIVLYQERGFGWWMLLAAWDTAFTVFRLPYAMWRTAIASVQTNNFLSQAHPAGDSVGPYSYRELLHRLEHERELLRAETENAADQTEGAADGSRDAAVPPTAPARDAATAWDTALAATRAGGTLPHAR